MIGHATSKLIVSWLRTTPASRDGRAVLQCGLMARSLLIKRVLVACCPTRASNHSRLWARLVGECSGWHVIEASGARVRKSLAERLYGDRLALTWEAKAPHGPNVPLPKSPDRDSWYQSLIIS